jgi:hypothetical protein
MDGYRFDEADSLFTALTLKDSTSPRAYFLAGENKEHQLLLWDALDLYLKALSLDAKFSPAYGGMSRVFGRLNSPVLAADAARTFAQLTETDVDLWMASASAYIDAGQFTEAQNSIAQAEKAGLSADAVTLLKARMEFLRHNYAAAESAAALAVNSTAGRRALADFLESHGYADSATSISRALFKEDGSHAALMDYFFRALRNGYWYDARHAIAEMKKRDKSGVLAQAASVLYLDGSGDYAGGREAAQELKELRPLALSTYAYLIQVGSRTANLTMSGEAGEELMAVIDFRQKHPILRQYALYKRMIPRIRLMAPPAAIITLDTVTMIPMRSEVDFQAWYAYALELMGPFGGTGDSLPSFEEFTTAWGGHPAMWTAFAATRMGFSPVAAAKAETILVSILQRDAHFKPAFDSLYALYGFMSEFGKRAAIFEKYPHFVEHYPVEGMQQAIALAAVDRKDEAVAIAEKVLPMVKGCSSLLGDLTQIMVHRGEAMAAMALVEKALAMDKKNVDLLTLAARVACDNGDCKRGLEYAEEGLESEPENRRLIAERGRGMFDSGDQEGGLKVLDEQENSGKGTSESLLYLSRRMAILNKDPNRAQDLARQAMITAPLSQRASINLAYVYLATGRYDLGRGAAKSAANLYLNDPEAYYLLGKAMYLEKKPEAKENLLKAVQFGIKGDALQDTQAMLQRL